MKTSFNISCTNVESFDGERISKSTLSWIILLTLGFVFIIIFGSGVLGVACNATIGVNGCDVNSNLQLRPNTFFQYNGSSLTGVINITAKNIVIDCNGSTISGNRTVGMIGILYDANALDYSNVTIKNCTLQNFYIGLKHRASDNAIISYNNFFNNTIAMTLYTDANGNLIENNSFKDISYRGLDISNSKFNKIRNNNFDNSGNLSAFNGVSNGFIYSDATGGNNNITNNYFDNSVDTYIRLTSNNNYIQYNNFVGNLNYPKITNLTNTYKMLYFDSGYSDISFNNFSYTQYPIYLDLNSGNYSIHDNLMFNLDVGSRIGGYNHKFYNNTIRNVTINSDFYDLGLKLFKANNITIEQNNFTEIGTCGIWLSNSTNITIKNNNIIGITFSNRPFYNAYDNFQPPAGIMITPTYKTWITEGKDIAIGNVGNFEGYRSDGINISGNIISNFNVKLWNQGGKNINHDLNDTYYVKIQISNYLYLPNEFYIDNAFTNLSTYNTFQSSVIQVGYKNIFDSNFTYTPSYTFIKNTNQSNLLSYNLTNTSLGLAFTSNGSLPCGNSLFTGDCNVTLQPNNYSYVYNNYVLTEGRPLTGEPFNFTSTSTGTYYKTYSISSNLLDNLTIPVNLTVPSGYVVTSITVTPKNRPSYKVQGTQLDNTLYIPSVNISYSTSSNVITLGLTTQSQSEICAGFFDAGMSFGSFIALIIIVSIAGIILTILLMGDSNLDATTIIVGSILIGGIVLSIGMAIISNINQC